MNSQPALGKLAAVLGVTTEELDKPINKGALQRRNGLAHAAVAAIHFSLEADDGLQFLKCWNERDFDTIRSRWPEAPDGVFFTAGRSG